MSAPRDATRMLSALNQALENKEMAAPVPEKQRVPGGSKWGDGTLEDPPGAGRRRGGVTAVGGVPGLRSPGHGV